MFTLTCNETNNLHDNIKLHKQRKQEGLHDKSKE